MKGEGGLTSGSSRDIVTAEKLHFFAALLTKTLFKTAFMD